jgi:hypothetical protein
MALTKGVEQWWKTDTLRGTPGFYRVGQTAAGAWWIIGPDDVPVFIRAVNGEVSASNATLVAVERIRGWGFNALGAGMTEDPSEEGMPFFATVGMCGGAAIRARGVRLPDVFAPGWRDHCHQTALSICPAWSERRDLLGWLADLELEWGGYSVGGPVSLLQVCLSLEPGFSAYHAAWEFVLAPYAGQVSRLGEAWDFPLRNREEVRELTRTDVALATAGYRNDQARWAREFAQKYFAVTTEAIRAADANHLIFGAADAPDSRRDAEIAEVMVGSVDVAWLRSDERGKHLGHPAFVGDFNWPRTVPSGLASRGRKRSETTIERILREGRDQFRAMVAQETVVGYAWQSWSDRPGEQPPFARGLMHLNGVEAREHTELLTELNARVSVLRPTPAMAL